MIVQYRDDRTVVDREVLVHLSGWSARTIRAYCTPVEYVPLPHGGSTPLYDYDAAREALANVGRRVAAA